MLAALAGAAFWVGLHSAEQFTPNGGLAVEKSSLDFGEVWEDPEFKWTLPIANSTSRTVEITNFQASCACLAIEPKSLVLAAGEQKPLQLRLDLRFGRNDRLVRDFSVQLLPRIKDASLHQEGWTVAGKVRKVFDIVPEPLFFEEHSLIRGEAFPSMTVELRAYTKLTGVLAECRPPVAAVAVMPGEQRNTFAVAVTPNSDLPAGNLRFDVVLRGLTTQAKLPPATLRVHGRVLEQVELIPPALLFGHRTVGEHAAETVLLRSRTGKAFRVLTFESSAESIEVERVAESPASPPQFRIRTTFLKVGQQSAGVSFRVLVDDGRNQSRSRCPCGIPDWPRRPAKRDESAFLSRACAGVDDENEH